jgi:hypothetical protein
MLFSGFSDTAQNLAALIPIWLPVALKVFLLQAIIFFRLLKISRRFQSRVTQKSLIPHTNELLF